MLGLVVTFLSNPARAVGSIALVLATLVCGVQEVRIVAKNHALQSLEGQLDASQNKVGQLTQELAGANASLQSYADLSAAARASQAAAEARAAQSAANAKKALAALQARPLPVDCASAASYGVQAAPELLKGWK